MSEDMCRRIEQLEGDIYKLTREIIPDLQAKYERLLNKAKCSACGECLSEEK